MRLLEAIWEAIAIWEAKTIWEPRHCQVKPSQGQVEVPMERNKKTKKEQLEEIAFTVDDNIQQLSLPSTFAG